MSYALLSERKITAARKAHRCIWCGQTINAGEPYTYERSVYDGAMQSHHWHPECLTACHDEMRESRDEEFLPYENARPVPMKGERL